MSVENHAGRSTPSRLWGAGRPVPAGAWRALVTVTLLTGGSALGALMTFLAQTLLARGLGPHEYGLFASSLASVSMIAPLAGFGLGQFRMKVYGAEGWQANRWLRPSLHFIGLTTGIAFALVVGWALVGARDDPTRFMLLVLSPVILGILAIELIVSKSRLEDRFVGMALWLLATPAARLSIALAVFFLPHVGGSFAAVSYGLVGLLVALAAMPQIVSMMRGRIDLKGHGTPPAELPANPSPSIRALWSQAWAFGVYAALYPIFYQISTILLKYLSCDASAGRYSIALAVMTAIYLIPTNIYPKYLQPMLHRWVVHDRPKFWRVYWQASVGMLGLGMVVGTVMAVAAPWAVPLVFGEKYRTVSALLQILALCVPLRFLSTAVGAALLTENHMRLRVYAMAMATVFVIGANTVFIPQFQEHGAAWATVLGELVLLAGTAWGARRFHRAERMRESVGP